MTVYEKWWLAVDIFGGLVLLFLFLDAVLARTVYVRTRLVEPSSEYAGHHRAKAIGGRS